MISKCTKCGTSNFSLDRCDEHYRCDVCGSKENLFTRNKGVTCDACHKQIAMEQVASFEGDTDYTDEIQCPWCGYRKIDSWEEADEDDHVCSNCENSYHHARYTEVSYCTEKIELEEE